MTGTLVGSLLVVETLLLVVGTLLLVGSLLLVGTRFLVCGMRPPPRDHRCCVGRKTGGPLEDLDPRPALRGRRHAQVKACDIRLHRQGVDGVLLCIYLVAVNRDGGTGEGGGLQRVGALL